MLKPQASQILIGRSMVCAFKVSEQMVHGQAGRYGNILQANVTVVVPGHEIPCQIQPPLNLRVKICLFHTLSFLYYANLQRVEYFMLPPEGVYLHHPKAVYLHNDEENTGPFYCDAAVYRTVCTTV